MYILLLQTIIKSPRNFNVRSSNYSVNVAPNRSPIPTRMSQSVRKSSMHATWKNSHPKKKKSSDLGRPTESMNIYQPRKLSSCARLDDLDLQVS